MKWRWMAMWLAVMLCTVACKKEKTEEPQPDLELKIEEGVKADPSEINRDSDTSTTTDDKPADSATDTEKP